VNGRFYSGSAYLDGGEATLQKLRAALTMKFGQPSFSNASLYVWKWKWPQSRIGVDLYYQVKFGRSTVTFNNDGI
jgi:hypothetical protein